MRQPVYVSLNLRVYKVNAPIDPRRNTGWLGPVGHIEEANHDGRHYRYYSPDRSQGLPQPPRDWQWAQGCE